MQPLEIMAWLLCRCLYYAKILFRALVVIIVLCIIFNLNNIINWLDALNLSFYIKKYELMQLISGIISGLITFIAMKYIDDLNKKRIYNEELIKQKFEMEQQYETLLEQFFEDLQILKNSKQGYVTLNAQGDFIEFLSHFSTIAFDIFQQLEKMEKFFPLYKMDFYTHRLYRYKYMSRGADKAINAIKEGKLDYLKSKTSKTVQCPKIEEFVMYRWPIESFDKISKDVYNELMRLSKKSRSLS